MKRTTLPSPCRATPARRRFALALAFPLLLALSGCAGSRQTVFLEDPDPIRAPSAQPPIAISPSSLPPMLPDGQAPAPAIQPAIVRPGDPKADSALLKETDATTAAKTGKTDAAATLQPPPPAADDVAASGEASNGAKPASQTTGSPYAAPFSRARASRPSSSAALQPIQRLTPAGQTASPRPRVTPSSSSPVAISPVAPPAAGFKPTSPPRGIAPGMPAASFSPVSPASPTTPVSPAVSPETPVTRPAPPPAPRLTQTTMPKPLPSPKGESLPAPPRALGVKPATSPETLPPPPKPINP